MPSKTRHCRSHRPRQAKLDRHGLGMLRQKIWLAHALEANRKATGGPGLDTRMFKITFQPLERFMNTAYRSDTFALQLDFPPTSVEMLLGFSLILSFCLCPGFSLTVNRHTPGSELAVKETHFVPRGWTKVGVPSPEQTLAIRIKLTNKRFGDLESHLYEISDPSHHRYRQHYSKEDLQSLIRPAKHASDLVDEWLYDHGIDLDDRRHNSAGDWISVTLPVALLERMLNAKYELFRHVDGTLVARTTEWSLPDNLHEHISTIHPTTAFLRARPNLVKVMESPVSGLSPLSNTPNVSSLLGVCNFLSGMTPGCLRRLYDTEGYVPRSPDSHIAFTNYLGQVASRSDAATALSHFRKEAVASAQEFQQISIDGGLLDNGTSLAGIEGNLDLQTILGQVWPINVTSYSTGGSPPWNPDLQTPTNTNEPYLAWLDHMLEQDNLPQTISTSYGDDEQSVPLSYAKAVCEGFAYLGIRGVSVLFSSGDFGVGKAGTCLSSDGRNTTMFMPTFPASCPYVTAVGGTLGYPEVVAHDPANGYVTGSGFSNYFPQPAFQKASGVVNTYVKSLQGQHSGLFNAAGRAFPDVAAQSYRYSVFLKNSVQTVDGTSASVPTVASIFALVNDALMADGQRPLGFLNPWLYLGGGGKTFTDIINGSSTGCGTEGFAAKEGWDVASGWGTPHFGSMLEMLGLSKNRTS